MSIKLVVSDIDGTLIGHSDDSVYYISDETVKLVNGLKDRNIYFTVATGRHYKDALKIMRESKIEILRPAFVVGLNGAQIFSVDQNKLLLEEFIEDKHHETVYQLHDVMAKDEPENLVVMVFCEKDKTQIVRNKSKKFDAIVERMKRFENCEDVLDYSIIDNIRDSARIHKMILIYNVDIDDGQEKIDLLNSVSRDFTYVLSGDNCVEVMPKNVSKGAAVKFLKEQYEINRNELIVVGDSGNDISMFAQTTNSGTRNCAKEFVKSEVKKTFDGGPSVFVKKAIEYFLEENK